MAVLLLIIGALLHANIADCARMIYQGEAGSDMDLVHENSSLLAFDEMVTSTQPLHLRDSQEKDETAGWCQGDSGKVVGCNCGCSCGWSQQCYPMYEKRDSLQGEQKGKECRGPHHEHNGHQEIDIGMCSLAMWLMALISTVLFVCTLTSVVVVRLCLQWSDHDQVSGRYLRRQTMPGDTSVERWPRTQLKDDDDPTLSDVVDVGQNAQAAASKEDAQNLEQPPERAGAATAASSLG